MISKENADLIKNSIGSNYAKKILNFFDSESFTRLSGEKFITQDIYNLLSGKRYDALLHSKILDAVKFYSALPKKIEEQTKEIKKNTEAATSA